MFYKCQLDLLMVLLDSFISLLIFFSLVLLSLAKTGVLESSAGFVGLSLLLALLFLVSCVFVSSFMCSCVHTCLVCAHLGSLCFLDGLFILSLYNISLCPS